jgi:hypothetical protein
MNNIKIKKKNKTYPLPCLLSPLGAPSASHLLECVGIFSDPQEVCDTFPLSGSKQ